jgi:hypothetical protein
MIRCPNCGSSAQVKSMWSNNSNTMSNHEYICGCGCHWVDRYEFMRRDVIYQGDNSYEQTDRNTQDSSQ